MTRGDTIQCIHEPFGDPFYFGPEKISPAFANDPEKCVRTGHAETTYASIVSSIEDTIQAASQKRIFVKDMAYHVVPCYPHLTPETAAPSLAALRTEEDIKNPSLLPWEILKQFIITFLIRNPIISIPSKYKFTVPPLQKTTGMKQFYPNEIGYRGLRLMLDFLLERQRNSTDGDEIVVVDAADLLADPSATVRAYCERVGVDFDEDMMTWDGQEDSARADALLAKYRPYHLEALNSTGFVAKERQLEMEAQNVDDDWKGRFGEEGAEVLRHAVDGAMEDYEYLRQFRLNANRAKPS